ncbi:MAG: hypothetical protein Q8K96_18805 [Rubrivivax sp.]|nr:hypothetical protein [Rubrivivax sp.]
MQHLFKKSQLALAAFAALGATAIGTAPDAANAAKVAGTYVAGDFHNHTTCSDGSISMQKLVKKSTDKADTPWGLDWFVQAGHGGGGNRNCTLVEDASLSTPAYPYVAGQGPTTTWTNSIGAAAIKGNGGGVGGNGYMWRWQSIQEFQYPVTEYLAATKNLPVFMGLESVVAGHEHTSMTVITGQMPLALDYATMPTAPGGQSFATAVGNATALAQWSYCFDRGDTDTSRGNTTGSAIGNNWVCSVPGSANAADPSWNATAQKLMPASGTGNGTKGHLKTVEAMKWLAAYHPNGSYYVPAHLERAGPFNPDGNNGFNVEHLRNLNNAAPSVAFGFETQPGHGASGERGEYRQLRNTIAGVPTDSVGGTTYGGTGVYGAYVGGVWDALLGEGRNWWFFASSDWHNRGSFGPDDRRSTQDFYPGEYQRNYTMVRNGADKLRPQSIVDGLRTGNNWASSGQLIDRLAFVACASYAGPAYRSNAAVEAMAVRAATGNTDTDTAGCATMGEKLVVRPGAEIVVTVVARDPAGSNYSPYTFANPSLAQVGITQPLNQPVLDHIDLIRGMVTGYKTPGSADYAGEWPRNTAWLRADGTTADLSVVPAAAKNTSATVLRTFNGSGATPWVPVASGVDNTTFKKMTYRIPAVTASQYVRLRGTNLPAAVPYETDASGNPLSDTYTNGRSAANLKIACNPVRSASSQFDGCPDHLPVVNGQKMVAYDVAAWADLWFYSNPIYVQVTGSAVVAGVR